MRPVSPDDRTIDATGKFIQPGLIDAHCHISLHQGALPGVKYTSSAEFCTLWAAHAIGLPCPPGFGAGNQQLSAERSAELTRCQARYAPEILGHAALARKPGSMRNLGNRADFIAEEFHRMLYPPFHNEAVR